MTSSPSHLLPDDFDYLDMLDQSSNPINIYDTDLRFIYANPAYLNATNKTLDQLIGKHVFDAFPETRMPGVEEMFRLTLAGKKTRTKAQAFQAILPDGETVTQYWKGEQNPIYGKDGKVKYILQRARNVTDHVRLEDRNTTIAAELDHRVRNLMSVLQSVAAITAQNASDIDTYTRDFQNRLAAIARTYHDLASHEWQGLSLRYLLESELSRVAALDSGRYTLSGPELFLTVKSTKDASLVLHEMVTNATKYGCFSRPEGRLDVKWRLEQDRFIIEWDESGLEDLQPPEQYGFGSKLISMLSYMQIEREFRPTGLFLRCTVSFENSIDRVDFQDRLGC